METEWITPTGKTQSELDAERNAKILQGEKDSARRVLESTNEDVMAFIDEYFNSQGIIDSRLHYDERQEARNKLSE